MNIILFTSAMIDSDFANYEAKAKIKPNPSNQNFYSKLIKSLSIGNNLAVISHRPLVKGMFRQNTLQQQIVKSGNVTYYYTHIQTGFLYKCFSEGRFIEDAANQAIEDFKSDDFIVVTDTLRLGLLKRAIKIARSHNNKVVGMLTDNPHNISGVSNIYKKLILKAGASLDGYLSLTSGLVSAFNPSVDSYVFEGLVDEETSGKKNPLYNYFYFGGSLYERYGVKTLIDGLHKSSIQTKLVVAGGGPLSKYIEKMSQEDPRILFISQINKNSAIGFMKNAIACINPRPLNKKMDNESVPSKLLEYISLGVPVISTKYPRLYGMFKDDISWIDGNDSEAIKNALENYDITNQQEAIKKASVAKAKIFEFYSTSVQAESINHFLTKVNSSRR